MAEIGNVTVRVDAVITDEQYHEAISAVSAANEYIAALEAENAKLRDELANAPKCEACEAMLDCDECLRADGSHKERRRLSAENAKLRELAALWIVINKHMSLCATTDCGQCPVREECEESVYLEGLLGIDPKGLSWRVQKRMAETTDVQAENAKLRESLERAAGIITDICGECPVSRYEWLSSDGCAEKCGSVTEDECWIAYLTGKRWDESGVEVDG